MSAYGLGPLPGTSIAEAADLIVGETGDLPHLPQLPARGLGSDLIGCTAGLLAAVTVDRGPRSWIMTDRPQLLTRRTWDRMARDLDECEEAWGTSLTALKVQVAGPWSLAASIELANGHRVITDRGALRDLTDALIEGTNAHVADVAKRFHLDPAEVVVQLDEPRLPAVVAGELRGATDFHPVRAVNATDAAERLAHVVESLDAEQVLLNQTGYAPLWELAVKCGARTVLVTLDQIRGTEQLDGIGQAVANGLRVGLGVTGPEDRVDELGERPREKAVRVARFWDELSLDRELLATAVDVHPRGPVTEGTAVDAAHAYRMAVAVEGMLTRDAGDP
ncbi:hypothetical protein [Corynebacterium halotolerans]|uniref:Uncharacterized protein n=1 Tax=Corynebacterium halotolerans YIM 70093 = DSM 44683 TaxID=1121362 RepID=M1MWY9_9CORY|nr:hypothetical protein [Corynebacterium halotolerans]AGF72269.1 hypothetical protein A605_06315 [Corynebacterium halotolerans YIM 70093 = DSM 44683]